MILYNKIDKQLEINNVRVEKLYFYSPPAQSQLYYSIVYDNNLYFNVQYCRYLHIYEKVTINGSYNNTFGHIIFNSGLSNLNTIPIPSYTTSISIQNFCIKNDISGNTYHIGYTKGNNLNNDGGMINFTTSPSYSISSSQYNGYIIKYLPDFTHKMLQFSISGSTFDYYTKKVLINDYCNMNNNNYVNLTSDNYISTCYIKYKKFDDTTTNILVDNKNLNNTCSIIKFNDDFSTLLWYKKFYGAASNGNAYIQCTNIETSTSTTSTSFHIVADEKNNYLYTSISGPTGNSILFCTDGSEEELLLELNGNDNFIVSKLDSNGDFYWNKPIYHTNTLNSNYEPNNYIKKIIFNQDYIYMLVKTYNNITINNISYGVQNKYNIFIIKMDKDGNFTWIKNISNSDDTTTDITIYNDEYLLVSCYYNKKTKVDTYNLISNGIGSYIVKMDINSGEILNVINKSATSTIISPVLKIKTLNVINNSLFIGGDLYGGAYIGGRTHIYYKETLAPEFFVEEIKIKSI